MQSSTLRARAGAGARPLALKPRMHMRNVPRAAMMPLCRAHQQQQQRPLASPFRHHYQQQQQQHQQQQHQHQTHHRSSSSSSSSSGSSGVRASALKRSGSGRFDPIGDVQRELGMQSNQINPEVREAVERAVESSGYRLTVGEAAARAGVKLADADAALKALAYDSLGHLEVQRCCIVLC
jgi:hypothetical protein